MNEDLIERMTDSEEIFDGIILHVFRDIVTLPNQKPATRELLRHVGAVCIVPITENNEVILERQFRYPLNQVMIEIPAGKLDSADEERLSAAKRELMEETGYLADEWIDMGLYYPAAAYSDEKITMYLARGLHQGPQKLDEDEFLTVYKYPLDQAIADILSNRITDGKTQTAILKAAMLLKQEKQA